MKDAVIEARERIKAHIRLTDCRRSEALSTNTGAEAEVIAPEELRSELTAIGAYFRDTYDS